MSMTQIRYTHSDKTYMFDARINSCVSWNLQIQELFHQISNTFVLTSMTFLLVMNRVQD